MTRLRTEKKVIGIKQSRKMVQEGNAVCLFYAQDAEARMTDPLLALCRQNGVEIFAVPTMQELGEACGIDVGAAVATLISDLS